MIGSGELDNLMESPKMVIESQGRLMRSGEWAYE